MLKSKFIGCLIGCAIGDALGSSFEGLTPEIETKHFSGHWTDDTHMMMGVAESLIKNRGFNGDHMARVFIENYEREPWRGYAYGPPQVFEWIKSGMAWNEASRRLFDGAGSYGNGGAMRVAPVGLLYYDDLEQLRHVAYSQSQITHAHELGKEGAALQARAVALAVDADPSSKFEPLAFLKELRDFTENKVYKEKLEAVGRLLDKPDELNIITELGNSIEAHNSVPTAIYSFLRNFHSFRRSVFYAVSLGGDSDTIGAMTGAISGAYHGAEGIPRDWKAKLERGDYIKELAEKLWHIKSDLKRFGGHQ